MGCRVSSANREVQSGRCPNSRTGKPCKPTSSKNQKQWLKGFGEGRKDTGDGGGPVL